MPLSDLNAHEALCASEPDAESVMRYVMAKWPDAMQSPLAQAMHGASAMLQLEASNADAVIAAATGGKS